MELELSTTNRMSAGTLKASSSPSSLSDFNREHADLEAVREKARAVAAQRVREQDAAARIEDHVAVAEHLATKLQSGLGSCGGRF